MLRTSLSKKVTLVFFVAAFLPYALGLAFVIYTYDKSLNVFYFVLFGLWLVSAIAGWLVIMYFCRKFLTPINRLASIAFLITQGNNATIPYIEDRNSEVSKLYDAVRAMNDSLLDTIHRLERANQLKSEFISIASHQLRTPLSAIKWVIELLMDNNNLSPDYKGKLQDIYTSNQRLIVLVNDLLSAAKLEGGKIIANRIKTDVAKLVENEITMQKSEIGRKKIKIDFKKETNNIEISVDTLLFGQVIKNLLENAIAYSPEDSEISIDLREEKNDLVFSFHNEGPGIPEMEHDKLFTKFYRGPVAQRLRPEGSGLGLFIAKLAVEANGGNIWFESPTHDGGGVTFFVSVPVSA